MNLHYSDFSFFIKAFIASRVTCLFPIFHQLPICPLFSYAILMVKWDGNCEECCTLLINEILGLVCDVISVGDACYFAQRLGMNGTKIPSLRYSRVWPLFSFLKLIFNRIFIGLRILINFLTKKIIYFYQNILKSDF